MDNIKDENNGPVSRFFEKESIRTNPFGRNQSAERLYRRAERVVTGLYLVTNHIPPSEPLKAAVRSGALSILQKILRMRDEMRATNSAAASEFRAGTRSLISLVRILSVAGFLSTQNSTSVSGINPNFSRIS